jgi:hypothetical protein
MHPAELDASARRTFVLVIIVEIVVVAGLWVVGRIYG